MNVLQYQLSNGSWVDVNSEDVEKLLLRCEKHEKLNREEVIEKLESGRSCRIDSDDWYSVCRYKPEPLPQPKPKKETQKLYTCKSCGETGHAGSYPFTTAPLTGFCDDCL